MKGVILSLPTKSRSKRAYRDFSLDVFVKRYVWVVVFTLFFMAGVVWGAVTSVKANEDFLLDMDFLFTTNLQSRLSASLISSFMAHFASNFIFFSAAALCGLSPWGVGVLPFIVAFKGFGTGLSAAYLISSYGLKGLGFYFVVVLPGTFIFSLCLLFMCCECSKVSLRIARYIFKGGEGTVPISACVKNYLFRCAYFLLLSATGALCDMLLWSFVSGLFF